MTKLMQTQPIETVIDRYTDIRVAPDLRCVCGRSVKAGDIVADDAGVRLVCPRCHTFLLELERVATVIPVE
jgi:hypothetical protein